MIQQARTKYVNTLWRAKGSHIFFFCQGRALWPSPSPPRDPSPPNQPTPTNQPTNPPNNSKAENISCDDVCLARPHLLDLVVNRLEERRVFRAKAFKPVLNSTHRLLVRLSAAYHYTHCDSNGAVRAPLEITRLVLSAVLAFDDPPLRSIFLLAWCELILCVCQSEAHVRPCRKVCNIVLVGGDGGWGWWVGQRNGCGGSAACHCYIGIQLLPGFLASA